MRKHKYVRNWVLRIYDRTWIVGRKAQTKAAGKNYDIFLLDVRAVQGTKNTPIMYIHMHRPPVVRCATASFDHFVLEYVGYVGCLGTSLSSSLVGIRSSFFMGGPIPTTFCVVAPNPSPIAPQSYHDRLPGNTESR